MISRLFLEGWILLTHYALHKWNDISLKTLAYEWKLVAKISEF